MAQWQRSRFVIGRLWVRLPPRAPRLYQNIMRALDRRWRAAGAVLELRLPTWRDGRVVEWRARKLEDGRVHAAFQNKYGERRGIEVKKCGEEVWCGNFWVEKDGGDL